jgi:hypothetical protein
MSYQRTSDQEAGRPVPPTPPSGRRATLSPQQLERARSKDRIKYARRMARDPNGFRAKRCAIQARYNQGQRQRRRGVQIDLVC